MTVSGPPPATLPVVSAAQHGETMDKKLLRAWMRELTPLIAQIHAEVLAHGNEEAKTLSWRLFDEGLRNMVKLADYLEIPLEEPCQKK